MSRQHDPQRMDEQLRTLRGRIAELEQQLADCQAAGRAADRNGPDQDARDAHNYLETVIATSHDGILVIDSEGRFEFGNDAFFRIFGWPPEELIGHHFIKVVPPDMHEFILERWEEVQAGKGAPYEVDIVRKDGTRRNLLVSHRHMTIACHRKYCVITKDVTETKQAEETLAMLGLIAEQVADSVLTTDLEFRITYANRSFQLLYGYSREELLGQSPDILNAEGGARHIQSDIYEAMSAGRAWRGELKNRRKDGSTFPAEMTVFPLVNDQGETFAYAGIQRDISERKHAEETLRQSERRFRAIFEQTYELIGLLACDGTILMANRTALSIVGLTESDVVGKPCWESPWWTHSPQLQEEVRQGIGKAAAGEFVRFDAWHPGPDGLTHYVDSSVKPVTDEAGHVVMLIVEGHDITDRKQAEEALRQSEQRFDLAVRGSSDGLWDWSISPENEVWWSPRYYELLGYEDGEIKNTYSKWAEALHPADKDRALAAGTACLEHDTPLDIEYRLMTKSGQYKWFRTRGITVRDDKGEPVRMAGSLQDITDRKQAEEALRQSEQRFDLAVRGSSDGLWDWGTIEHEAWWSPRFYELLGYEDGEIEASYSNWIEFIHPADRDRALAATTASLEHGAPFDVEYRLITKSGRYKWFRGRGITVRDDKGEPVRMAGSLQDITDRKRVEDELARHRDRLEEMVQIRTGELTEAQGALRKAHSRLLNVVEAERRRLAREMHDSVGQKLAAIAIGIQLAAAACEETSGHEAEVRTLHDAADQCSETIREIRTICHGLYPPALESMGLAAALRQLGRSCEPVVSFHLHCEAPLAETRLDAEQEIALFRIAQEAVNNALRHGEAANVSIFLERQGEALSMAICDDGVGFDTTLKPAGLGLRSMEERARAIGGTAAISSRPGRTRVEVSVPAPLEGTGQA